MSDDVASVEYAGSQPLVLVADDDEGVRLLIVAVLRELSVRALVAGNGAVAVQLASEHRAALRCAILDVRMPVLDGLGAARAIRAIAPTLAIVMMSSFFPGNYRQQVELLQLTSMLDKPFSLSYLREIVGGIIAKGLA
jgi:CheY-like chemotaxis protein